MLINLSNHPSTLWSEKQITESQNRFDEIVDISFPNIPAAYTTNDIFHLAQKYLTDIITNYANYFKENKIKSGILITGEQTFVVLFVRMCTDNDIQCYTASSERNSIINTDGTETKKFEFIQYRKLNFY